MPENAPNLVTQPQLNFLRKLAHQVTGDGNAHLAAFTASHSGAVTTVAASAEIKRLKALADSGAKPPARRQEAATTVAPVGRYAVDLPGNSMLVEITKPSSGRWAGYTFVKTVPLLAGVEPEPVKGKLAADVLKAIDENPRGCAGTYGRITGRCGQCNRRLSDPSSKELGVGPECMGKFADTPQPDYGTLFRRASGPQAPERF
jgi:hypothetical protein